MCKILYLTPDLYKLEPQVITEYVANIETYSVEVGGKWKTPLDGKSLEERETLLASKLEEYFEKHNEVDYYLFRTRKDDANLIFTASCYGAWKGAPEIDESCWQEGMVTDC